MRIILNFLIQGRNTLYIRNLQVFLVLHFFRGFVTCQSCKASYLLAVLSALAKRAHIHTHTHAHAPAQAHAQAHAQDLCLEVPSHNIIINKPPGQFWCIPAIIIMNSQHSHQPSAISHIRERK